MNKGVVLYIEDESAHIYLIRRALEQEGYQVIFAASGHRGIKLANKQRPNVILVDLYLPDITGLEVATRIKDTPELGYIPVVMLTSDHSDQNRAACLAAGADAYLAKPVLMGELVRAVNLFNRVASPAQRS